MINPRRLTRTLCLAGAILTVSGAAVGLSATAAFATNTVTPGATIAAGNTPYSTAGKACDPQRDGYHFIMNQLAYPAGSVIDASDFGKINITFSDGSTADAMFTDLSGSNTAHFLNSTVNRTGNFTIKSATMTFPAGSDITGYGNLVVSHPPCGTVTATVDPTTTVAAADTPTTTAAATDTPTTLVASQTPVVPTTTTPNLGAVAPSLLPTTPTAQVASEGPVPPVALPSTGRASGQVAILGLAAFGLGLTLMGLARKARPMSS